MAKKITNGEASPIANLLQTAIAVQVHDDDAVTRFPILCAALLPTYDGLTLKRQEGSLRITPDGDAWRVQIECPSEKVQTVFQVYSLASLFEEVENLLTTGKVRFRAAYKKRKKDLAALDRPVK